MELEQSIRFDAGNRDLAAGLLSDSLRSEPAFYVTNATVTQASPETVVEFGSNWNYLDDGSNQGTAWQSAGFDDSSWSSGPAEFGYGDGDEATVVSFGGDANNKFTTTYFRHAFNVADAAGVETLDLSVIRDDGVAVYVNGVEILRDGLPAGATFDNFATQTLSSADEPIPITSTIAISSLPAGTLVGGSNVLAVEVHQANLTSSDISFDLDLAMSGNALELRADLSSPIDAATLQAADLIVNGTTATGVTLVDADTVIFALPALAAGQYTATIQRDTFDDTTAVGVNEFHLVFAVSPPAQYLVKHTPRLQLGDAPLAGYAGSSLDQVEILWQTVTGGSGTQDSFSVEYRLAGTTDPWLAGSAASQINTGAGSRINHSSVITGLNWDTDYEYRVRHLRAGVVVDTYQHTFRTRLQAGDATSFSFAAYGDSASGDASGFRQVQSRVNQIDPAFTVLLGDNVYNSGTHDESDARFDPTVNPEATEWIAGHIDYLGLGNHDVGTSSGQPSEDNFSVPIPVAGVNAPFAPPASERSEHNFSWDYGDVHFLTFDTNSLSSQSRLDGLLDWAIADLNASTATWKIVYGHHPIAGAPDKPQSPSDYYYQQVVQRLKDSGVDLFMVGHSHTFSWTFPLTGQTGGVAEYTAGAYNAFDVDTGLPQLVSGLGGKGIRTGDFSQFPFVAAGYSSSTATPAELGFAQIDVTPTQLTVSYVAADDGAIIDSFTITAGQDSTPPAASLITPQDNGPGDLDGATGSVSVTATQPLFEFQLSDGNSGVDDATVTSSTCQRDKGQRLSRRIGRLHVRLQRGDRRDFTDVDRRGLRRRRIRDYARRHFRRSRQLHDCGSLQRGDQHGAADGHLPTRCRRLYRHGRHHAGTSGGRRE